MARRATIIRQARENTGDIVLTLDAGSTLFGESIAMQSEGSVIVQAMNAMGYDAMTLGRYDLAMGVDTLLERAAEASFPFLSANLVNAADRKPLVDPYVIIERQGKRFGIIGISEPEANQVPGIAMTLTVLDATETTTRYVEELADQVDAVIVLSHLGLEADLALAEAVPGIDIIVGGNSRELMKAPQTVGDTLVVQQGYLGEWLGRLTVRYDEDGKVIESNEELIALTEEIADDPTMAGMVAEWVAKYPTAIPGATIAATE
ncbi:MAG: bifunctional metallophosphatase/5'-nucleotidase [Anaerolineae bacterium]